MRNAHVRTIESTTLAPDLEEHEAQIQTRTYQRLRMTIEFPAHTAARLIRIKELTGASSFVEVLRSAIRFYEIVVNADKSGAQLTLEYPTGKREVLGRGVDETT